MLNILKLLLVFVIYYIFKKENLYEKVMINEN